MFDCRCYDVCVCVFECLIMLVLAPWRVCYLYEYVVCSVFVCLRHVLLFECVHLLLFDYVLWFEYVA